MCQVAKGHAQIYGLDYDDTISLVTKWHPFGDLIHSCYMAFAYLSVGYQEYFLHGDLAVEVHLEQPTGFIAHAAIFCTT